MPSEFILDVSGLTTPEDKGGPRAGIGGKVVVRRDGPGAIGVQILRGDGLSPEEFNYSVRAILLGPFEAGEEALIELGALDLPAFQDNDLPRTYRMRVVADGGAELTVIAGSDFVATEPYAPPP